MPDGHGGGKLIRRKWRFTLPDSLADRLGRDQEMASLDNHSASHGAGALLRRHGGPPHARHPRAVSPRGIMARDARWCDCSGAVDHRVRACAVRALEEKRPRRGDRFRVLDD